MWGMLERPITAKHSDCSPPSGALRLAWASSCMQGWRVGMEDAHLCLAELPGSSSWRSVGLFGVLDGHGGEQVAKFCESHLPKALCSFQLASNDGGASLSAALTASFHGMDELLRDKKVSLPELESLTNPPVPEARGRMMPRFEPADPDLVGCTACLCCITPDQLIVANAGDSRAVLCRGGTAIALSEDHKPNQPRERKRIEAAGGFVEISEPGQYRVNGNLNLSRALGDLEYKQDSSRKPEEQIICATPDVEVYNRTEEDEFAVICCDGVWDRKTNQQVVDFIRSRLLRAPQDANEPREMANILEALLDDCLSPDLRLTRGCGGDNMTAVLVRFPRGSAAPTVATVGSAKSLPVEAAAERPCIIRLKLETAGAQAAGGALVVRVALPTGCVREDVTLRVSEVTAKLEVSCTDGMIKTFGLQEHLPKGAELSPLSEAGIVVARFFARSETLRISLPWKMPA